MYHKHHTRDSAAPENNFAATAAKIEYISSIRITYTRFRNEVASHRGVWFLRRNSNPNHVCEQPIGIT